MLALKNSLLAAYTGNSPNPFLRVGGLSAEASAEAEILKKIQSRWDDNFPPEADLPLA